MPQYERGHSGQEIGELQQRLSDLGFEISVTNEFDEYTEETLRRYQQDWLYAEGTGVADETTLGQLEYHHSTRPAEELPGPQFGDEPIPSAGASSESHWWDGNQWIPFENPTPLMEEQNQEPAFGLIDEETQAQLDGIGGGSGSSQGYDGGDWNPFANPTPLVDEQTSEPAFGLIDEETQAQLDGIGGDSGQIGGPQFGEEPLPDVRY